MLIGIDVKPSPTLEGSYIILMRFQNLFFQKFSCSDPLSLLWLRWVKWYQRLYCAYRWSVIFAQKV